MKGENKDEGSILYLVKECLMGACGGIVAGVVITLYCLPFFAAFGFVFWVFLKLW